MAYGTINVDTLTASTGVLATQNGMTGIAKAWVQFNGSTGTINNSFNISSVTVINTGNYTINFTTAMPNINYVINGNGSANAGVRSGAILGVNAQVTSAWIDVAPTTTAFTIVTANDTGTTYNPTYICLTVHGS